MGMMSWIAARFRRQPRAAAMSDEFYRDFNFGIPTASGAYVNWRSALESPTALRCGVLIADGVSTVPCKLMRTDPATGNRVEAKDHPLYDLLRHKPCGWMTSQQFRETMMLRTVFEGQAFAYINRVRGRVYELFPFDRGEVTVERRTGTADRSPLYRVNGEEVPADRILHFRGPSWDGRVGLDMVSLAREVIGLADAAQDAHAKRFGNGIQTSGIYSVKDSLEPQQHERLTNWIAKHYAGRENSGKPLVLDRGADFISQTMTGVDAEHLATRQHQDMLICRHFGVLPIMVGITDKTATYASAEQMFLAHAVHTIRPWHERVSEVLDGFLLTPEDRAAGYYFHFVDMALLRGAAKDRAEYYAKLFQVAGIKPNKVLALEDMDGFPGGDSHYVPANFARVREDGSLESASKPDEGAGAPSPPRRIQPSEG